ncbi:MAG: peptidoglycan D,D-transpeptidase FtsI family protein [Acidimicrobiales bacterium]
MNRQIRRLTVAVMLAYLALFAQLNNIQIRQADDLRANPDNTRDILANYSRPRGTISTIDGALVARSVEVDTALQRQREYPDGELYAQVSGYFSLHHGSAGVERAYDEQLAGQIPELEFRSLADLFVDRDRSGSVVLSLREDVQRAARDALGEREGSVVVLDAQTGEVVALWSWPSYDPNLISQPGFDASTEARSLYLADRRNPLLGRAYQERYFPGSTFKVVVAAAGLESGLVTADAPVYDRVSTWVPPLTTRPITNAGSAVCGGNLAEILRASCNTSFAEMGSLTLGPGVLTEGAEAAGFNSRPPFDLPSPAASIFPTDYGAPLTTPDSPTPDADVPGTIFENTPALAQASIGQYDVQATPLHMALIAAGVGNNGRIMQPRVVHEIRDADGGLVERYEPDVWLQAMSPATANQLRQAMVGVVTSGTATRLAIDGYEIGAKTGTARTSENPVRSHAWIMGFAGPPGQAPELAFAVVVLASEEGGAQSGGVVAAPVARQVLEVALRPAAPAPPPEAPTDPPPEDPEGALSSPRPRS